MFSYQDVAIAEIAFIKNTQTKRQTVFQVCSFKFYILNKFEDKRASKQLRKI